MQVSAERMVVRMRCLVDTDPLSDEHVPSDELLRVACAEQPAREAAAGDPL